MADLVIRGMEMPTEQRIEVLIFKNGFVAYYDVEGRYIGQAKAVHIPEGHGRLGDLDALMNNIGDVPYKGAVRRVLMSAPTIIEADLEWKMKNCCCFSNTDQAEGGTEDGN